MQDTTKLKYLLLIALFTTLQYCAHQEVIITPEFEEDIVVSEEAKESIEKGDEALNNRHRDKGIVEAISLYQEAIELGHWNQYLLNQLSRAHYIYAHYLIEDPELKIETYSEGKEYGMQSLLLNKNLRKALDKGDSLSKAIPTHTDEDDYDALFWCATNWYFLSNLKGLFTTSTSIPRIKPMLDHIIFLDEIYMHGGPHRLFALYYLSMPGVPPFAGKNLGKAKEHFKLSIEIGPKFLQNYVLYAEKYAVQAKDRELFDELLDHVIKAPDNALPDYVLENRKAKERAKALKEKADELFKPGKFLPIPIPIPF